MHKYSGKSITFLRCYQSACQSCNLAKLNHAIAVFMHTLQLLTRIAILIYAIKRRTQRTHMGGRGRACALAFFLYYYHPPHNFFCNNAPRAGLCLHMVMMGCYAITHPRKSSFHAPLPPVQHDLVSEGICL